MEDLKTALMNSDQHEFPILLDEPSTIRFVEVHLIDLQEILSN
jgi:hypothetical protein